MLGHPLAATIGDSARCMQNLEKGAIHGAKDLRHGDVYLRLGLKEEVESLKFLLWIILSCFAGHWPCWLS